MVRQVNIICCMISALFFSLYFAPSLIWAHEEDSETSVTIDHFSINPFNQEETKEWKIPVDKVKTVSFIMMVKGEQPSFSLVDPEGKIITKESADNKTTFYISADTARKEAMGFTPFAFGDSINILEPKPGIWTLKLKGMGSMGKGVIQVEAVSRLRLLIAPSVDTATGHTLAGQSVEPGHPVKLRAVVGYLEDGSTEPGLLQEVQIEAQVTGPRGTVILPMKKLYEDQAKQGFQEAEFVQTDSPGRYNVDFVANGAHQGVPFRRIFSSEEFSVAERR